MCSLAYFYCAWEAQCLLSWNEPGCVFAIHFPFSSLTHSFALRIKWVARLLRTNERACELISNSRSKSFPWRLSDLILVLSRIGCRVGTWWRYQHSRLRGSFVTFRDTTFVKSGYRVAIRFFGLFSVITTNHSKKINHASGGLMMPFSATLLSCRLVTY